MFKQITAVALVMQEALELIGPLFDRAYPVDQTPCFDELLQAIDEADCALWQQRNSQVLMG